MHALNAACIALTQSAPHDCVSTTRSLVLVPAVQTQQQALLLIKQPRMTVQSCRPALSWRSCFVSLHDAPGFALHAPLGSMPGAF